MNTFEYYNPTRIIFGENQIAKLDVLLAKDARILILYGGGSVKRTGTLAEVKTALANRVYFEFGGIEANPEYDTLLKAVDFIKENNIDFLLAVGGGSVIDGTKFIAAARYIDDPWQMLLTRGADIKQAMPLGTVLTISATGSEMNKLAVVTRKQKNAKLAIESPLLFPQFSILDPKKTLTLPVKQVANGVVDAYVHVLEQYLTYPVNAKVQDRFSEGLLLTLIEEGPKVIANPNDLAVRANLMLAATMALNGLIAIGVPQDWATHQIGHQLTVLYGIDHAQTLAIILPGLWKVNKQAKFAKLVQYAERVWNLQEGTAEDKVDLAIAKTEAFFNQMGIKTKLSAYGLAETAIDEIIALIEQFGLTKLGETKAVTPEIVRQILITQL